MAGKGARAGGWALALAIGAAGCGAEGADELPVARRFALPVDSAVSLDVGDAGRLWVGRPGEMVLLGRSGESVSRLRIGEGAAPRVIARLGDVVYARAGGRVFGIDARSGAVLSERDRFGESRLLADVRGRYLYQGTPSGAVLAHDPRTLEPRWGWAARGAPTTALAAAPEGDVLYQALAPEAGRGEVLIRDLQTGRILARESLGGEVDALATTPDGDLLAVVREGRRGTALRLRPRAGDLLPLWRFGLDLEARAPVELRYHPGSGLVALFQAGNETGPRVLDAEAGDPLGSVEGPVDDVAFSPDGALYALAAGEVRIVSARPGPLPGRPASP